MSDTLVFRSNVATVEQHQSTEDGAWSNALERLQKAGGVPMTFGGPVHHGALQLTYMTGHRTGALAGIEVRRGAGLGGQCWLRGRLTSVDEYARSTRISHDYDAPVRSEGLRAVVAVPVLKGAQVRGVMYAGFRDAVICGDRIGDISTRVARALAHELEIEDAVAERTRAQRAEISFLRERVRELHASVRTMRSHIDDPALMRQLDLLDDRTANPCAIRLGAREIDVLALAADGSTYPTIARRLLLSPQTVKSYMRDIIQKLGVTSRHEAVVRARQIGLLP